MGMSQPPNSTMRAPQAVCQSYRGVRCDIELPSSKTPNGTPDKRYGIAAVRAGQAGLCGERELVTMSALAVALTLPSVKGPCHDRNPGARRRSWPTVRSVA